MTPPGAGAARSPRGPAVSAGWLRELGLGWQPASVGAEEWPPLGGARALGQPGLPRGAACAASGLLPGLWLSGAGGSACRHPARLCWAPVAFGLVLLPCPQ